MGKRLKFIVLFLFCTTVQASPIDLYIIAGQSNANGVDPPFSSLGELSPQDVPYEFYIGSIDIWQKTEIMQLQNLSTFWPTYQWICHGAELSFAYALEQRTDREVAIVKVSWGGTNSHQWRPSTNWLYSQLVTSTNEMKNDLVAEGYEPEVAGMIWVQGEADANEQWFASNYYTYISELFTEVREEFGPFPILLNRLHSGLREDFLYDDTVRQAQQDLADNLDNVHIITIDDLELRQDQVHLRSSAQIEMGYRFADILVPSGDFDRNGVVNTNDLVKWNGMGDSFLTWQRQYISNTVMAVPEPNSILPILITCGLVLRKHSIYNTKRN